jgi:hypothetical protein
MDENQRRISINTSGTVFAGSSSNSGSLGLVNTGILGGSTYFIPSQGINTINNLGHNYPQPFQDYNVLPNNVKSLDKKLVGLKEDTVYVTTDDDGKEDTHTYYIKSILGVNPETLQVETTEVYHQIDFIRKTEMIDLVTGENGSNRGPGVSNEQLIIMITHRLKLLNEEFPCNENEQAIKHLDYALAWLDKRTINRFKRSGYQI